jgi:hypothetical protein
VEVCAGFELIAIENATARGIENATARGDDLLESGQAVEVPVGKRLIQDRPEGLGGLQFGRVPGQINQPDPIRHSQVRRGVPTVCQPALSSPSTMRRSRPAPASRANSASSAAKNGLETPFDTYQKVAPEIGCTKAVPYNHL